MNLEEENIPLKIPEEIKEKVKIVKFFRVMKAFTLDKFYRKSSIFESADKKVIEKLLNENYIK